MIKKTKRFGQLTGAEITSEARKMGKRLGAYQPGWDRTYFEMYCRGRKELAAHEMSA